MEDIAQPGPLLAFWRTSIGFDRRKIALWLAFRNAIGVALPLAIGLAIDSPLSAVAVSSGALNVCFSDDYDPYRPRARRMLLWTIVDAIAVFLGSYVGFHDAFSVILIALWALGAGMLLSVSTRAGDLGINSLVVIIVFASRPQSFAIALYASALSAVGGLLQILLSVSLWPIRKDEPEREVLAELYKELSTIAASASEALSMKSSEGPTIDEVFADSASDHTLESERFRILFDQGERLRLSLFAVRRFYAISMSKGEEEDRRALTSFLRQTLSLISSLLGEVVDTVEKQTPMVIAEDLDELGKMIRSLDGEAEQQTLTFVPEDMRRQLDSLAAQVRTVISLAERLTPAGFHLFAMRETRKPWKLRIDNWTDALRANASLASPVFRHALRLAVCVGAGDTLARCLNWRRNYWIPMTIAIVLKPDFTVTFSRGVQRLMGTFFGLGIATLAFHVVPKTIIFEVFFAGLLTFLLRGLGQANYAILSASVGALVVLLIALTGVAPSEVITARAWNTAIGGLIALAAYALWPTWARTQTNEALAALLDASRLHLQAIVQAVRHDEETNDLLDQRRLEWRRALLLAQASSDRESVEPRSDKRKIKYYAAILAQAHATTHAMMALEAGFLQYPVDQLPERSRSQLRTFINRSELMMYFLAAALRGYSTDWDNLPKLRDDHNRVLKILSEESAPEFIGIETDRMTVGLNSLRDQVASLLSATAAKPGLLRQSAMRLN